MMFAPINKKKLTMAVVKITSFIYRVNHKEKRLPFLSHPPLMILKATSHEV